MRGGNVENGRTVFRRNCIACHKLSNEGADYGPQMDGKEPVGKRLTKYKIVESIIDPNAEVDPKYLSTALATLDGKTVTGLLLSETKDHVIIFDGKEKKEIKTADIEERTTLKQSSMPEGLAATMAPVEFLDPRRLPVVPEVHASSPMTDGRSIGFRSAIGGKSSLVLGERLTFELPRVRPQGRLEPCRLREVGRLKPALQN